MVNDTDVGLSLDRARKKRGVNNSAGDTSNGEAENTKDRHERKSDSDHDHCICELGA